MERSNRWRGYGARKDVMPLGGHALLVGVFGAALTGFLGWAARSNRLRRPLAPADALVLGVARTSSRGS